MNWILTLASVAVLSSGAFAQVTVDNSMSPQQLVEDVLVGQGVQISNVTYNGQANVPGGQPGIGSFEATDNAIVPLAGGVVLATTNVTTIPVSSTGFGGGSGQSGDPDLSMLAGGQNMNDISILEFDFVPIGDTIRFNFIFASNEYQSFTCSNYNDVFGFFLSGPGINGPFSNNAKNIALVPNTNVPIGINTLNSGSSSSSSTTNCDNADPNWQANSVYFVNNIPQQVIDFNGLTVPLTAWSEVICGETYHIKLAIADAVDSGFDSGVFLEAGSFASTPIVPAIAEGPNFIPGTDGEPNTILRSCLPVIWTFQRIGDVVDVPLTAQLDISGSAVAGVDYTPDFPEEITFAANETEVQVEMFFPANTNGPQNVIITITSPSLCANVGIINEFEFLIDDPPPMVATGYDTNIQCGEQLELTATFTGGFAPFDANWAHGATGATITVSPTELTTYSATFIDTCGTTATAEFQVGLLELPPVQMFLIGSNSLAEGCDEAQINVVRPAGVEGDITIDFAFFGPALPGQDFQFPGNVLIPAGEANVILPFAPVNDGIGEEIEHVMVVGSYTDACGRTVDAEITFIIFDAPQIWVNYPEYFIQCDAADSLLIAVEATGGYNNQISYSWSHDADETGPEVWVPVTGSTSYTVTASDPCGSSAQTTINVIVDCELVIPNVMTPNGDGVNDTWDIEGITYLRNTVRIFDRWGTLVHEASNYKNNWGARDLPDGTYFYEILVDMHEEPYKGYLTILRNSW